MKNIRKVKIIWQEDTQEEEAGDHAEKSGSVTEAAAEQEIDKDLVLGGLKRKSERPWLEYELDVRSKI